MNQILIKNCDILAFKEDTILFNQNQDLLIEGQRIAAIGNTDSLSLPPMAQVIDATGMLALPGLINTHAHVPMVLLRGLAEDVSFEAWFNEYIWPLESNLIAEDVYWGALLGMAEMIENGITFVADHYFFMDEVARAVSEAGMRANLSWAVFGHEGEAKLERTCHFVKEWQGEANGRITTMLAPHAPYTCSMEFLRSCAKRAEEMGVGIHTHVSESAGQVELSLKEYQRTPVQVLADAGILNLPTILAHCIYAQPQDFPILKQSQVGIAHAPKTYMKLGMGTAPVRHFIEQGIPLGLATDGTVSNNTLDILEQARLMALTQKQAAGDPTVMPLQQVLHIAFQGSAQVVRQSTQIGDLAPGKLADLILLRQDGMNVFPRYNPAANLVYSSHASDVDTVICDGKILMLHRQLLTINKARVKREVTTRLQRLSQRVQGRQIAHYPTG